jgi:adenine-specific DNA-methyltransferase
MSNRLHCGDCLDFLRTLPDGSVDAVVTDPPYFKVKDEAWDHQWDTVEEFLEWFGDHCREWVRVLKPGGSLYVFASSKLAARVELEVGRSFAVLNRITWRKPPFATKAEMFRKDDLRMFFPASESIIFAEQKSHWYEPLRKYLDGELLRAGVSIATVRDRLGFSGNMPFHWFARGIAKGKDSQWQLPTREHYEKLRSAVHGFFLREYDDLLREHEELRRPFSITSDVPYTDVWDFPTVPHRPGKHPCQKPVAMIEHMIFASSTEGMIILDPFMGSGTTGVACVNTGRNFIGCEIDPGYSHRRKEDRAAEASRAELLIA